MNVLLPGNGLRDVRVGISVSQTEDLDRLGLRESHLRLALAEIARTVLVAGGELAYGGHLRTGGYTRQLNAQAQRYGAAHGEPLLVCLAWHEHRELPLSMLERLRHDDEFQATIVFLDLGGEEVDPAQGRGEEPVRVRAADRPRGLTAMRQYLCAHTDARVFIGGRRRDFTGTLPGLMEEVLIALRAAQPTFVAGGFGGAAADISRALGIDDGSWLPPYAQARPDDDRWVSGMRAFEQLRTTPPTAALRNGLSDEDNRRLAMTYRPSEVSALVGLGLGILNQRKTP
jgi:hypothetical protein